MHDRSRQGVIYGIAAYGCWGLIPLYFKSVAYVPPLEVLAHRVAWSLLLLGLLVTLSRRWADFRRAITSKGVILTLAVSTLLLGVNWLTYIYAVSTNQVVEASLGYFLNPLVNVVLGVALLKEPLRGWQMASVGLAVIGVAILGAPPIAITLALSFAFYALLRKHVAVDGMLGLLIETILLVPLAIGYLSVLACDRTFIVRSRRSCHVLETRCQLRRHGHAAAVVHGRRPAAAVFDARFLAIPGARRCSFCWRCWCSTRNCRGEKFWH